MLIKKMVMRGNTSPTKYKGANNVMFTDKSDFILLLKDTSGVISLT